MNTMSSSVDPTFCRYPDCQTTGGCVGVCSRPFRWGEHYGKDLLTDINQLAHAKGTGALFRDALQRAYAEIVRLRHLTSEQQTPKSK